MPSGHKAFLVNNTRDVELLLMHNKTFAAEYVPLFNLECNNGETNMDVGFHTPSHRERESILLPVRSNLVSRLRIRRPVLRPRFKVVVFCFRTLHGDWDCEIS